MGIIWNPTAKDELLASLRLPEPGTPIGPDEAKRLAVLVALRGVGHVAPNPLVGAVLVDADHRFLAAGAHERVGQGHAEVNAFEAHAKTRDARPLKGGTLYVTLEPCAHAGRTPACAPRVASAGLAKVVYGVVDPNPKVNGQGAAILRAAGVASEHDAAWAHACERLAEIFLWNVRKGSPFVALKVAAALDGVMARRGDSRAWITSPRARSYGHFLRTYYDAIAVGQNTLILDDPKLDARDALVPGRAPWRVAVDPDGAALRKLGPGAKILSYEPERVAWVTRPGALTDADKGLLKEKGARHLELGGGQVPPKALLAALQDLGLTSLLLEGGAGLYGPFLRDGFLNRLHLFQAPRLLGGGPDAVNWTKDAPHLTWSAERAIDITPLAADWLIEATMTRTEEA